MRTKKLLNKMSREFEAAYYNAKHPREGIAPAAIHIYAGETDSDIVTANNLIAMARLMGRAHGEARRAQSNG